jgi:diguanylate cyclase (GGDEF)-like protein
MEPSTVIKFRNEASTSSSHGRLKVLAVDDDKDFQTSMHFALSNMQILGRDLEIIQAYNYAQAAKLLAEHNDFAIALVDVIMDTNDAGLRLVKATRDVLGNSEIRIILITGQPGVAPMHTVMQDYDIDDYWSKAELNTDRLKTLLTSNTRSYQQIQQIARAKRGLQLIAESSGALYTSKNLEELSIMMLTELAKLLDVSADGLVCVKSCEHSENKQVPEYEIISATGSFIKAQRTRLSDFPSDPIRKKLYQCLTERHSLFLPNCSCLFFYDQHTDTDYAVYLATNRPLDTTETELLRVFSTHVYGGLINVALISQLDRLAFEDTLLKIPNSNTLLRVLDRSLEYTNRRQNTNLLLLDIDNFSQVNAVLGPDHGDMMLRDVTQRLRKGFDASVLIARIKDDKFALVGLNTAVHKDAVLKVLDTSKDGEPDQAVINVSTVTFPLKRASTSAQDVLTRAGIALKNAKKCGIRQHVIYSSYGEVAEKNKFTMLNELQLAIKKGTISIALQPQFDVKTGRISGVETLARWQRDNGSWVPPDEFITLAEASGIIHPLSKKITHLSCQAAKTLRENGWGDIRVGINLSAIQLEDHNTFDFLASELAEAGVDPQQIELEITETVAMQSFERIVSVLNRMREKGYRIAIDDFGTGFSSLTYLNILPVDRLKIDKIFIDHVADDRGSSVISEAIINLADKFGMNVIAEGVESEVQLQWLKQHGCNEIQGFLIARPMPLTQLLQWLDSKKGSM